MKEKSLTKMNGKRKFPIISREMNAVFLAGFCVNFLLFATAKSIELDERIPFITRLQRYSGLMMFKPREFAAAEQVILRELKWNLQCLTTVDLMDYYFSQGMLFSNDILTEELSDKSNNLEDTTLIEKSTGNNDLMLQINSILNTPLEKYSSVSLEKSISAPSSEDEVNDFTSALESL